jgi:tetratricopeptide (TPR) repeat protein
MIEHGGGINGFNTTFARFVTDKHLIVLLDNTSQGRYQGQITDSIANILYGKPFETAKRPSSEKVFATITEKGLAAGIAEYKDLKTNRSSEYDVREAEVNALGYMLVRAKKIKDAIEIFKLNVEMFQKSANTYDSLGEAYALDGNKELAIKNYEKALELQPDSTNASNALAKLRAPPVKVDPKVLERYAGEYELGPGSVLTVTVEDGNLFIQATGQGKNQFDPLSENKFELLAARVVVEFIMGDTGNATSLILHQGGRDMPAKRRP